MIVLYNPHVDDFLSTPPHFTFLKRKALKKYGFLIERLKENGKLNVIIDDTISVFVPNTILSILPKFFRKIIVHWEFNQWIKINQLENCINLIKHNDDLSESILFTFSYKSATSNFMHRLELLNKFKQSVFHLSHYFVATQKKAQNLKLVKNLYLAGDSNILDNQYFQHFFHWYDKPFLVLPFAVSPRFQIKKKFELRKNQCVATGSFHNLDQEIPRENYLDFIAFTKLTTYHPIRKEVFNNKELISNKISCYVTPYRDYTKKHFLARFMNHFIITQKKYFSVDIVELYNDYKFAVIGEEVSGFPALGAFEAIASGCILIANPIFYKDTGLIENKHFIPYDGSLSGLILILQNIISDNNPYELAAIQESALKVIYSRYTVQEAANTWINILNQLN